MEDKKPSAGLTEWDILSHFATKYASKRMESKQKKQHFNPRSPMALDDVSVDSRVTQTSEMLIKK